MLSVYSILFILIGVIAVSNSLSIAIREKSLIKLPHLFKAAVHADYLKYKFYSQIVTGYFFIAYGFIIYELGLTNLFIHLLFATTLFITFEVIAYLKFVFL